MSSPEVDAFITKRGYGLKLDEDVDNALFSEGQIWALRSQSIINSESREYGLMPNDSLIDPTFLQSGDVVSVVVSGIVESTGNTIVREHSYSFENIRCGIYEIADNNLENFNRVLSTGVEFCRHCRFNESCGLDVKRNLISERAKNFSNNDIQ